MNIKDDGLTLQPIGAQALIEATRPSDARFYRIGLGPLARYTALAVLAAAAGAFIYAVDPRNPDTYPVCPFFGLMGWHCPGCGTLRGIHMLLHGNVVEAVSYNALAMIALPSIAYTFVTSALRDLRFPAPAALFVPHQWVWLLCISIVAFAVIRNVPYAPFSYLAP